MFVKAHTFLQLHELEQQFRLLGGSVIENLPHFRENGYRCRELGRSSGFFASATMISGTIDYNDRLIDQEVKRGQALGTNSR